MKIAVTGAGGYIGSHLTKKLIGEGHEVHANYHIRIPSPFVRAYRSGFFNLLTSEGAYEACKGTEILYHCAGQTMGSGGAGPGGVNLVNDNVVLALRIFKAAARAGVRRVISMSSTTGYPDIGPAPIKEDEYFTGKVHPAYFAVGESKRFIERIGEMYPELEVVWLRCTGSYGPGNNFDLKTSHVIEALIRKVAERHNPMVIWGDGQDRRDGVYIDDLINALVKAQSCPPGAYNIATGTSMKISDILSVLLNYASFSPGIIMDRTKPAMVRSRDLDITKAREILGWVPSIDMRRGLMMTYDWYTRSGE